MDEKIYNELDCLHYEVENHLLKRIKSLQEKQIKGGWEDSFILRDKEDWLG